MKINEVESRVGITKKNIRFYEQEGLLFPRRGENGYRDYGPEEVMMLKRIKLLRKLGLPLEEIRQLQAGRCTVGDAMRRHLAVLKRQQADLEQSVRLCAQLREQPGRLCDLDADSVLARMEQMERDGTRFSNKQAGDVRRYVAPVVIALGMTALMVGLAALFLWACLAQPQEAPPPAAAAAILLVPGAVIVGVLLALGQRWKELGRGEEDEARNY